MVSLVRLKIGQVWKSDRILLANRMLRGHNFSFYYHVPRGGRETEVGLWTSVVKFLVNQSGLTADHVSFKTAARGSEKVHSTCLVANLKGRSCKH